MTRTATRNATLVWGEQGLLAASPHSVCIIVDVLSFSTSVDAACAAGALVYPYRWKDQTAQTFAASIPAELAVQRQDGSEGLPSLSPPSLANLIPDTCLVLPSPNGSTLSTRANANTVLCGCLRNASAVAQFINRETFGDIVVVAAGERWPDGSLRPALEDFLGAGAISLSCPARSTWKLRPPGTSTRGPAKICRRRLNKPCQGRSSFHEGLARMWPLRSKEMPASASLFWKTGLTATSPETNLKVWPNQTRHTCPTSAPHLRRAPSESPVVFVHRFQHPGD